MEFLELLHKIFLKDGGWLTILNGLWVTVQISALSLLLGTLFGALLCFLRRKFQAAQGRRADLHFNNSRLAGVNAVDVAILRRVCSHGHKSFACGGDNFFDAYGSARRGTFAFGVNGTRQRTSRSGSDFRLFQIPSVQAGNVAATRPDS